ncbi:MAG: acyl-CoA dehydrogenase family protein [Acidobacteriota bacterium]|nr:acyl-CoA dehydrogenase family protein [Acidobacteriota bacterium]MDH3784686.1 acyl-CoA dehydrogenase family protein [Acidobacteriota bacterium]
MSDHPDLPAALTELTEEEQLFRDAIRDFAMGEIAPGSHGMDESGQYADGLLPNLFEMGLMAIDVPEEHGGTGGTFFQSCLAVEEISRADAAVGVLVDVQNTLFNNALSRYGTDAQKAHYFPKIAADHVAAYALSEAGSGSDAFALACRGENVADGWKLNGQKLWITNAAEARLFLVFANVDPAKGYRGITAFLVERDDAGFTVGKREKKLGIRASSTCELILQDCTIPEDRVLGEVGKGYKIAIETLNEGRIGIGAQMLGVTQAALDHACRYSKERSQFGKTISEFQAVQHSLARTATELEAARLMVYNAARLRDRDLPFVKEAAMAKLYSSEVAERATSMAVEIFGGYGYTSEYPVEKLYRDAKIGKIYEGTSFMQLNTIAKMILAD